MPDAVSVRTITAESIVGRRSPQQLVEIVRNQLHSDSISESSEDESRGGWGLYRLASRPSDTFVEGEYGVPVAFPTDNNNVTDAEFPGVPDDLPISNNNVANDAPDGSIDIDEFDAVTPPRCGEEFERVKSPPSSSHSSLCEGFDSSVFLMKRNELIAKNFLKKDGVGDEENSSPKLIIIDDRMVTYCGLDDDSNHSDTDASESSYMKKDRLDCTIRQILKDTVERRDSSFESTSGGFLGNISFSYMRFQRALQMKWHVIMLRRFEEILLGRGQFLEVIPAEWEDYEVEFASIYGPMLATSEIYKMFLIRFQVERLRMYIDMLNREVTVLNTMMESRRRISEWSNVALEIKEERLQLELKLSAITEAHLDMNPYSNGICMDFFVLPRPTHTIQSYEIRSKECDNLIEYTEEDDKIMIEGYNPALIDVGCIFEWKVVGDHKRGECVELRLPTRKAVTEWNQTKLDLSAEMFEYLVGVESNILIKKYRQKRGYLNNEPVFGDYSDKVGVLRMSDVFYPQYLRERIILFPALLEGLILTPDEIIICIWNRIKHMLEADITKGVRVSDLQQKYENYFGQSLFPLNWGFTNVNDFIEYIFQHFPEELDDVKMVAEEDVEAESDSPNEWEDATDNDFFEQSMVTHDSDAFDFYLCQDPWFLINEPLPSNYIFKLPEGPVPHDMMS